MSTSNRVDPGTQHHDKQIRYALEDDSAGVVCNTSGVNGAGCRCTLTFCHYGRGQQTRHIPLEPRTLRKGLDMNTL